MIDTPYIAFLGMSESPALERAVRQEVDELRHLCRDIASCNVTIERPQLSDSGPALFNVCLTLAIPGWKFNINRVRREDAAAALNDVFASLRCQLPSRALAPAVGLREAHSCSRRNPG